MGNFCRHLSLADLGSDGCRQLVADCWGSGGRKAEADTTINSDGDAGGDSSSGDGVRAVQRRYELERTGRAKCGNGGVRR